MSDKVLRALMQLFAIVANTERLTSQSRHIVETFLKQQLSQVLVQKYLEVFDEFITIYKGKDDAEKNRKRLAVSSVKVLKICTDINQELNLRQKYVVLIRLIEFIHSSDEPVTEQEWEFNSTVAGIFNIPDHDEDIDTLIRLCHQSAGKTRSPAGLIFFRRMRCNPCNHDQEC